MQEIPSIIAFEDVSKIYDGGRVRALDHFSFSVGAQEFLAIVGPSGSGKSTVLRLINRLIEPSEGIVRVDGENIEAVDAIALRRRIGYVFQGIGLFPHLTVAENIAITPSLLGWDKARSAQRVDELLGLVRLPPDQFRHRMPRELSGGQAQRIGVARAIAAEPKIVLMDEPFGALDAITRDALRQDYRELHDRLGLTTVMITHDMLEAVLLADRIAVIHDGAVIADGTPRDLMNEERDDYVGELLQSPRREAARLQTLTSAQGAAD